MCGARRGGWWCGGSGGRDGGHMHDGLLPPLATFDPHDNFYSII